MEPEGQASSAQERIAGAALTLISERGLAGVTMSAIAHHAGVARQTLYNHYPNVESILTAVIEQHERLGFAQVRQLLEGHRGATAKLEQLIRHSVVMSAHGHALAAIESSLSPRAREMLSAHRGRTTEMLIEVLEEGVAEGVFRADLDSKIDAIFIREVLVTGADRQETGDVARLAGATVRFVLAAVGAPSL